MAEDPQLRSTSTPIDSSDGGMRAGAALDVALVAGEGSGDTPAPPENPALDEHATEPFQRCQGKTRDGRPCKVDRGLDAAGLCPHHSGRIDHAAAQARAAAAKRERGEALQEAVNRSKLAPRAALALRLAERQEEALDLLLAAALDDGDAQLLLRLWTEAFGKPGEAAAPAAPEPSWDEVLAVWSSAAAAGDGPKADLR